MLSWKTNMHLCAFAGWRKGDQAFPGGCRERHHGPQSFTNMEGLGASPFRIRTHYSADECFTPALWYLQGEQVHIRTAGLLAMGHYLHWCVWYIVLYFQTIQLVWVTSIWTWNSVCLWHLSLDIYLAISQEW